MNNDTELTKLLARVNQNVNNHRPLRAQKFCARLLRQNHTVEVVIAYAEALDDLEKITSARKYLLSLKKIHSKDPQIPYYLGRILFRRKRYNDAITQYRKVLRFSKDVADTFYHLGNCFRKLHRYEEALKSYEQDKIRGIDSYTLCNEGLTFINLCRHREAQLPLIKGLALDPYDINIANNLNTALRNDRPRNRSVRIYKELLAVHNTNALLWNGFARLLNEIGWHQDALIAIKKALELNPGGADYWLNSYHILSNLGKISASLKSLRKAFHLSPEDEIIRYNYGREFAIAEKYTTAVRILSPLTGPGCKDGEAMNVAAWAQFHLGNKNLAIELFIRSMENGYRIFPHKGLWKAIRKGLANQ